jgi:WD40 repeat protein
MVEQGSHSAPVRRIDVDRTRGLAVTASDDRTARVWDIASGELRHILRPLAFGAEGGRLYGVAVHPSKPLVAVGGTTGGEGQPHVIYLFDIESGTLVRTIDTRSGHVRKLAWSFDGSVLLAALAGEHGVKAFSFDGAPLLEVSMDGPVFGLAVSAQGTAAAVGLDGSLRTFRVGAGVASAVLSLSLGRQRAFARQATGGADVRWRFACRGVVGRWPVHPCRRHRIPGRLRLSDRSIRRGRGAGDRGHHGGQ